MLELYVPGMRVTHPEMPDWGEGQVQSAIGTKVTVNFEHAGKVVMDISVAKLTILPEGSTHRRPG